jgi:CRP-like cAMP-binding protein
MAIDFEANFFTLLELLDAGSRLEVEQACTKVTLPPGQVVYAQGDPANSVFIVVSGRVEAITHSPDGRQSRTVGVMGKGDFFGDLAVLTGQPRLAEVRTCEPTKLMQFEKLAFIRMLDKVPKVGAFFARNLAKRLHRTSTEAHVNVYAMDLAGNLEHFDLLVIFYTIISTGRTGELELHSADNEVIGSFFFRDGRLEHARLLHLMGLEAVWQGVVQPATGGTFSFHFKDAPATAYPEDQKIEIESNDLLAQGVTKRDAYHAITEDLRLMNGRLNRLGAALVWAYGPTQPLAERIWELIAKRPQPLDSLWRRLTCSSLTFLETVSILVETKQAEFLVNEPVEASAEGEPGAFPTATPPQT